MTINEDVEFNDMYFKTKSNSNFDFENIDDENTKSKKIDKRKISNYFLENLHKARNIFSYDDHLCPECFKEHVDKNEEKNDDYKYFLVATDNSTYISILNKKTDEIKFKNYILN